MKLTTELYNLNKNESGDVINAIYDAYSLVSSSFNDSLKEIHVVVGNDHEHMESLLGYERPIWGVTTTKGNTIFTYNPFLWTEEKTGHEPSDIIASIAHQFGHLFFVHNKITAPIWFEEGLVTYISDREKVDVRKKALNMLVEKYGTCSQKELENKFSDHAVPALCYQSSFCFIEHLVNHHGEKELSSLIESLKKGDEFERSFTKIYEKSSKELWECFNKLLIK